MEEAARSWGCPKWISRGRPHGNVGARRRHSRRRPRPAPVDRRRFAEPWISLAASAAAPWLPQPAGWGGHAVDTQQQDLGSMLALVPAAMVPSSAVGAGRVHRGRRRQLACGGRNLLICERSPRLLVAVSMGTEPVRLPAGTVLASAVLLEMDGWLQAGQCRVGAAGIDSRLADLIKGCSRSTQLSPSNLRTYLCAPYPREELGHQAGWMTRPTLLKWIHQGGK